MSDRLHDTLSSLRTDVDSTRLADSSAVRARGNQRTRRQAVGTSLAVVALVAGAVGIGGALIGTNKADAPPADPTTSESPSPAPTVETRQVIDDTVLLGAADLPPVPPHAFTVGETLDPADAADASERFLTVCGGSPRGDGIPERALLRTFPGELDASMWQWVAQYPSESAAETALAAISNACAADPGPTESILGLPNGAEGIRASAFGADPGSEFHGEIAGIVRYGDVVLVLGLSGNLREQDVDLAAFDQGVLAATDQLISALTATG